MLFRRWAHLSRHKYLQEVLPPECTGRYYIDGRATAAEAAHYRDTSHRLLKLHCLGAAHQISRKTGNVVMQLTGNPF